MGGAEAGMKHLGEMMMKGMKIVNTHCAKDWGTVR